MTANAPAGWSPCGSCRRVQSACCRGSSPPKPAELEDLDDLKRKFDEAAKYADIDQLGIAPQCGFASTEEGNKITQDDQWRKLELVVRTADAIWGGIDA